ncbi:hypothetical protein [Halobaculum magnesiiphilum]|uniref:Uncharacterized protein n=1 Tax=Halobaculum magnesiiphilum TaxID=1017351 RepID=A0A8T8WHE2_9EURY|nr:hypothetical protein [Halobaculum magnesiiphilum]QZP39206.1 hypothetical protein K6T50_16225 [Halobaculum magnesiiphilum]
MSHRAAAVASEAIRLALINKRFSAADVRAGVDDAPSRQTVSRVLAQLEADGWLARRDKEPRTWLAGDLAREHGEGGFSIDSSDLFG